MACRAGGRANRRLSMSVAIGVASECGEGVIVPQYTRPRNHRAALAYAIRLHFSVFPLDGKVPKIKGGRGCLDATRDPEQIDEWWSRWPNTNIGVATGAASGIWVLDVDGDEGEETLAEMERAHGPLPETVTQLTGKGRHLLFAYNGEPIRNAVRFSPGLDIRSTGGYIVVSPSIHPETNRPYAWSVDHHPLDMQPVPAPAWLLELVLYERQSASVVAPAAEGGPSWLDDACGIVPEGQRNATLARVVGMLMRRLDPGLAAVLAADWNQTHCRPPLPDAEVARVVDSIAGRELRRLQGNAR